MVSCYTDKGGDDLKLKGWDLRTPIHDGEREPTFVCYKGCVLFANNQVRWWCYIHAKSPDTRALLGRRQASRVFNASYDERLRIFDARQPLRPISETPVGGGIWRTKWHPTDPSKLLLGCMHGGFAVLSDNSFATGGASGQPMDMLTHFDGHDSIAYGCDWERAAPEDRWIYSCSFYDAMMHIWAW